MRLPKQEAARQDQGVKAVQAISEDGSRKLSHTVKHYPMLCKLVADLHRVFCSSTTTSLPYAIAILVPVSLIAIRCTGPSTWSVQTLLPVSTYSTVRTRICDESRKKAYEIMAVEAHGMNITTRVSTYQRLWYNGMPDQCIDG